MAKTITMKTTSGFEYEYDVKLTDDFELLELFRGFQHNQLLIVDVGKKMLGDEGYKRLKEHCTVDGVVSTEKMYAEIVEISNKTPDEIKK